MNHILKQQSCLRLTRVSLKNSKLKVYESVQLLLSQLLMWVFLIIFVLLYVI